MNNGNHPIVFAELIDRLRRDGFTVGTGHYLRLQQLLPYVAHVSPEKLRTILCPLFARSPDEQIRFYSAYDEFLATTARAVPVELGSPEDVLVRETARPLPRRSRMLRVAIASLSLMTLLAVGLWFRRPRPRSDGEFVSTSIVAVPTTTRLSGTPRTPTSTGAEIVSAPVATTSLVFLTGRVATDHPLALAMGVLLLLWVMEVARSTKRLWDKRRNRGSGRPFAWPLREDEGLHHQFTSAAFREAARLHRVRQASGQQRLDVRRTVQASARAAGDFVALYREVHRQPEYVLLIERFGPRDHLTSYFHAMAAALEREGVLVERYELASDLRTVRAIGSDEQVSTADLRYRHPDHRLLVCAGTADALLDSLSGLPVPWLATTLPWAERGLLLADASGGANSALREAGFVVGEATAAGLRRLAEVWSGGEERRRRAAGTAAPLDHTLDGLREVLTPNAWELLLRCSAHTTIEWPLTRALLETSLPPLDTENVLLELSRLAWFRRGSIPPHERQELLDELEAGGDSRGVRETVVRLLGEGAAPSGSTAARLRQVSIEAQKIWMHRLSRADFRADARRLRRYPLEMVYADGPLLALLRTAPATHLWHRVSLSIRRVLFPLAAPALGVRPFLGLPLLLLVSFLAAFGLLRAGNPEPTGANAAASKSGHAGRGAGSPPNTSPFPGVTPAMATRPTSDTAITNNSATSTTSSTGSLAGLDVGTNSGTTRADDTTGVLSQPATTPVAADTAPRAAPLDLSAHALRELTNGIPSPAASTGQSDPTATIVPSAQQMRLAASLPPPTLVDPVGRIELVTGKSGPIVFQWSPYNAYELVVWKGSATGQPLFTTPVRGTGYSWWPETAFDPRETYFWSLRGLTVPATLKPEAFMLAFVDSNDLTVSNDEEQLRRSRKVAEKIVFEIPCGKSSSGTRSVRFNLQNQEEIIQATTALTSQSQLGSTPKVSLPRGKGNGVSFDYNLDTTPAGTCHQMAWAEVTITATIGPHKVEPPAAHGGGGGGGGRPPTTTTKKDD